MSTPQVSAPPDVEPSSRPPLRRFSLLTVTSLIVIAIVTAWVVLGRWITPHDPSAQDLGLGLVGPQGGHWLGTDQLGRDVFSRLIAGSRLAMLGPTCVAVGTLLIGASLGMVSGYYGGRIDSLISRGADLIFALPALLVAVVVIGSVGGGYWLTVALFVFLSLPAEIRLCRSATMVQVRLAYVDAARTLGLSAPTTILRHVLPNIVPTVIATFLLDFVGSLVGFSSLAFLGLGVEAGSADWGTMLADGQGLIYDNPWMSIAPAVMLVATAAAVTIIGDALYDRFTSERERQ